MRDITLRLLLLMNHRHLLPVMYILLKLVKVP
jgi:hypothetical protein